jgi:hypothetical protein
VRGYDYSNLSMIRVYGVVMLGAYDTVLYCKTRDVFAFHQWRIGLPRLSALGNAPGVMSPFERLTAGDDAVSESFVPFHWARWQLIS